jgi:hypothetical protein
MAQSAVPVALTNPALDGGDALQPRARSKALYLWLRDLHLYFGLAVSPLVLVFLVSTVLLNHGWKPVVAVATVTVPVEVRGPVDTVDQAREILNRLGISGQILRARNFMQGNRVNIPVVTPRRRTTVNVDLQRQQAEIRTQTTGFLNSVVFLHVMPGPHRPPGAPNWLFLRMWAWIADGIVGMVIFLTLTGVYLWAVLKGERRIGLVLIATGLASFVVLVSGFFLG